MEAATAVMVTMTVVGTDNNQLKWHQMKWQLWPVVVMAAAIATKLTNNISGLFNFGIFRPYTVSMAGTTVVMRAVTMTVVAAMVTEEMAVVAGSSDGQRLRRQW